MQAVDAIGKSAYPYEVFVVDADGCRLWGLLSAEEGVENMLAFPKQGFFGGEPCGCPLSRVAALFRAASSLAGSMKAIWRISSR